MYTASSISKKASKQVKTKKDIFAAVIGALILLVILDLSPLGGNIIYYTNWARCGSRPVATKMGSGLAKPGVPNYIEAPNFGLFRSMTPYFCSAIEAEQSGYSAKSDRYDFPHLPKSDFQNAIKKSQSL